MQDRASQVLLVVKNPPANAGNIRDAGWIPELGRSSGGRNGYPLQYSCLENPMERRAWWAIVHRVANNLTTLNHFTCIHVHGQNCLLDEIDEILTFTLFYSLVFAFILLMDSTRS